MPLKAAWVAKNTVGLFGANSPYHDDSQPGGRKKVTRPSHPDKAICLAMALCGVCFSGCKKYHGNFTPAKVQKVATAGGLQV